MTTRSYGQFCGLARALEMIGERWTLLIVRNLLIGPKRYTDLRNGLPEIPTNILATRLKQLEESAVAVRRALPHPERGVVYELTDYGRELEPALVALGRWGAATMTTPRPGEIITAESLAMSFRTTFRPEAAQAALLGFELRMGDITISLQIGEGSLTVSTEPHPSPDLVIERRADNAVRDIMAGSLTPAKAIVEGSVRVTGDPALLDRFAEIFHF